MAAMLLVFAITLATMRIPYAAYDQQLYNSSTQLITLFADRIQGELENIEALSFRMLADNVLQPLLCLFHGHTLHLGACYGTVSAASQLLHHNLDVHLINGTAA